MRIALLVALTALVAVPAQAQPLASAPLAEFVAVGPFRHENLQVFILRGADAIKETAFQTLEEALRAKTFVVHETGSVNELAVENRGDLPVYVHAGEIVKGGQQDRTLEHDALIPPKSGRVSVKSFCVEQGRWARRGGENVQRFEASTEMLATKEQKLAARASKDQGAVWGSVAKNQAELEGKTGRSVKAQASPTSLQLTLEDEKVRASVERYVTTLLPLAARFDDAIGFAYAVNGKANTVDVYASHAVFTKLWPKLTRATAVEAFAAHDPKDLGAAVSAATFSELVRDAESGGEESERVSPRVNAKKKETGKSVVITSEDAARGNARLRKSYIAK
jgi:hypothetical protein